MYQVIFQFPQIKLIVDFLNDCADKTEFGDPVWSHGESYSFASSSGPGAMVETDSWTSIDNNGGLHVNNVTSDGTVIGYQVSGMTNCSQESWAHAVGSFAANAIAYGLCNSSVLLDQPVSNTGVGDNATTVA